MLWNALCFVLRKVRKMGGGSHDVECVEMSMEGFHGCILVDGKEPKMRGEKRRRDGLW